MQFTTETLKLLALASVAVAAPLVELTERAVNLTERQGGFSGCNFRTVTEYKKADDPNPHQNFVFKQISPSVQCNNAPGNSAAVSKGYTVGWSFNIGGAGSANTPAGGFLTAGFSISESVTTSTTQSFGCAMNDGTAHQGSICVFQRIQTTAFTVDEEKCQRSDATCGGADSSCSKTGNQGVMAGPNSDQGGVNGGGNCFYSNFQLGLPCTVAGNEIHSNPSSIPGGPQFVGCDDTRAAPGQ